MRLEFAREALADLDAIYRHGSGEFGFDQADRSSENLAGAIDLIVAHPGITAILPGRSDGLRRCSVGVHCIFFTADAEVTRIVRVLHQRMDPERHGLG